MTDRKTNPRPQPSELAARRRDTDRKNLLDQEGWLILPSILGANDCQAMGAEIAQLLSNHESDAVQARRRRIVGGRNLLSRWEGWRRLQHSEDLQSFVETVLGGQAGVVRILYFDKPPGEGWSLAMHQDRTIAVERHVTPAAPFCKPTRKAGVTHVEASEELLRQMLTLRVHLDPMHHDNGPLIVAPGTHHQFANHAPDETAGTGLKTIVCNAGDVFAMRPLLAHGSLAATEGATDHRRVVHLELASSRDLPGEYEWHQFVPMFEGRKNAASVATNLTPK